MPVIPWTEADQAEEDRLEKIAAAEEKKILRPREEANAAVVLAARTSRLSALEKGEELAAPEYLPGPFHISNFHLWSVVAFDYFVGDFRGLNLSSISFVPMNHDGTFVLLGDDEMDTSKPVSGTLYLDFDHAWDIELFKAPERFMERFSLKIIRGSRASYTVGCTLITEDHLTLDVPVELFGPDRADWSVPEGAPKTIELFGIRDRSYEDLQMERRQERLARAAKEKKKAQRKLRKRAAKAKRAH